MAHPLLAADESLLKQGTLASTPVGEENVSTIDWVVSHVNNSTGLMENVILTDRLGPGQVLKPGTLVLPQGWSAQYSTDGGTSFSTIEPASGVNALIFSNPFVVPTSLGRGRTLTLPMSKGVQMGGGGDGYNPALLDNGRIMGINHHSPNPNIWCYDPFAEGKCDGYPLKPGIPTGMTPLAIGIGNKLYLGDDSGASKVYGQKGKLYCWDGQTNRSCGTSPVIDDGYTGPVLVNNRFYVLTSSGQVDCYDPAAQLQRCAGFTPVNIGLLPGNSDSWTSAGTDMLVWDNRILIATQTNQVICFDVPSNAMCTDWAINPLQMSGTNSFNLFRRMDTGGRVDGFCASGSSRAASCYSLQGEFEETVDTSAVDIFYPGLNAWGEIYDGTRVFSPNYYTMIGCWDWATRSVCTGQYFSNGMLGPAGRPYGMSTDGSCLFSYGDAGTLYSWDPKTGASPCRRSSGQITVSMDDYFCKDQADRNARWDKVKFYDTSLVSGDEFDSMQVKLVNPATGETVMGPVEMIDGSGELDISGIPNTIRTLEMVPLGVPTGSKAWADGVPPKVTLTFYSSQQPRFCYRSVMSCEPGTGEVVTTRSQGSFRASLLASNTVKTNITQNLSTVASVAVCNLGPTIHTPSRLSFSGGSTEMVVDILSSDDSSVESLSGSGLVYSLSGGDDMALFSLGPLGQLAFNSVPEVAAPQDLNGDNVYLVEVTVTDPENLTDTRLFEVHVVEDVDGDGVADNVDQDLDGDGISNTEEGNDDTDGDGVPDLHDLDSDNDGIPDAYEAQAGSAYVAPSGVDGNGDGIDDAYGSGLTPVDSDLDGLADAYDNDDDNDTILTRYENADPDGDGNPSDARDTDGDGTPDYLDRDDDNDGKPTENEVGDVTLAAGDPAGAPDTDGDGTPDYLDVLDQSRLRLQVRGLLQGPYDNISGKMRDDLSIRSLIGLEQPYAGLLGYEGTETLSPALFGIGGDNAPVDWVLVELRDAAAPATRVAAFAGIIQRDGDVADARTNDTTLQLRDLPQGSYYVALRHRNHLGVMTSAPVALSATPTLVDFSRLATEVYGTHARIPSGGFPDQALLWAGDINNSNSVIDQGPGNDSTEIYREVLAAPDNLLFNSNYALEGYLVSDANLDGTTIYSGPGNDVNLIRRNVLSHPGNTAFLFNYIVRGTIPK
ncbi:MAG: hypothetical protein KDI44_10840 [Thiothrix sp.]|nr:hypothetical protein [Thiothrix sp.]HPQ94520.1 hypothetical protein [Thiolinea sp.]